MNTETKLNMLIECSVCLAVNLRNILFMFQFEKRVLDMHIELYKAV